MWGRGRPLDEEGTLELQTRLRVGPGLVPASMRPALNGHSSPSPALRPYLSTNTALC